MTIADNIKSIEQRIVDAAKAAGRDPGEVTLVAVSKRHPVESIRAAYDAGQRDFGENYAQELRDKAAELKDLADLKWHFIGNLQRNKVKYVVPSVSLMETVDSARLVVELGAQAVKTGRVLDCLVQVNVGGEDQKSGCEIQDAEGLVRKLEETDGVAVAGLMTIPPFDLEASETRVHFSALRRLRQELGGAARLPHLSMGMSHDFDVAVEEGATCVRVGTAIFGVRPPKTW